MSKPVAAALAFNAVTLVRRIRGGEAWYHPHRGHTYERLVQGGWSHARTAPLLGLTIIVSTGLAALSLTGAPGWRAAGDALVLVALATYLALPNLPARRAGVSPAGLTST